MFIFISLATIINNPEKQTKVLVSKLRILKVKRDNPNRSIHRIICASKNEKEANTSNNNERNNSIFFEKKKV
jgi:hypothetical protein